MLLGTLVACLSGGAATFITCLIRKSFIGAGIAGAVAAVASHQLKARWIKTDANEWLLVVKDGKLVKAGIGLAAFKDLNSVVVTFPSFVQKVDFVADQITKEMQGVRVNGFVVWSINRDRDGPLKAYRYLDGLSESGCDNANDNIKRMAESIVRAAVANLDMTEVIRNRKQLMNACKEGMVEVVNGWGVWLETVEVTEVKISSTDLFRDLQTEFREQSRRNAELLRQANQREIDENKIKNDVEVAKKRTDAATQGAIYTAQMKLKQILEEAKNEEQLAIVKQDQQRRAHELQLLAAQNDAAVELYKLQAQLERERTSSSQELDLMRQRLAVERDMSGASLQRMVCEATRDIYRNLPLSSVRLINIAGGGSGGASGGGLDSVLPSLMGMQAALNQAAKD